MGLILTIRHTTNLFSVFVDSDSDPDSKILDSKMSGLDSRKKLLDWTHYFVVESDGKGEEGECAIWSKRQITF